MRKCVFPVFVVAAVTLLVGCHKHATTSTAGGPPAQLIRIGNGSEPQDLDPQAVTGIPEHNLVQALFEGLASEDPKDLHPIPAGATSWDISPDGLVYTFHLRPEARWSDSTPITADDYVRSYQRMLSPEFASEYAYLVYNFMANAKAYYEGTLKDFSQVGVKALDPHTLQVTLAHRTPYLLKIIASHSAWSPVPTRVIERFGSLTERRTPWTRAGNLVGNGAFILKEWSPHQRIVLARNPQYWDAAHVKLDEAIFYPTENIATDERMFRAGQVDIVYELPNAKVDVYRKEYPQELRIDPYLGVYFYRCNVARPPVNDKRVRRALALAIDREAIVEHVMRGGQKPAYNLTYPGVSGYYPKARLTGDLAEAKRLLAEAGYPDGKGFPTVELIYNSSQNNQAVAEAVQEMWRRNLGVNITLVNQEWKVYLDMQHTRNFTLQRAGWIADYIDPHVFLEIWETGNGNNDTNWSNAEYDRLLHQALAAPTQEERFATYQKMDAILVDELPVIPIFYYTMVRAVSPRVRGYYPTLLDNHPLKSMWIGE